MNRSYAVFTVVLAVSMLIGIQAVEVVNANPVGMYGQKPKYATVTIDSPIYSSQLSFSVKTNYYWGTGSNLTDTHCFVILNNNPYEINNLSMVGNVIIKDDYDYDPYVQYILKSTTELTNLTSLASGTYELKIDYGYYQSENVKGVYNTEFISLGSATSKIGITQDMTSQQPTPSSSPALVSDSPAPASNQSQSLPTVNEGPIAPAGLNPILVFSILAVVIAMVAASISLVYFKRRKCRMP
jgi:hypothetical protein